MADTARSKRLKEKGQHTMRDLSTTDLDWGDASPATFDAVSHIDRHSAFEGTFRSQRDLRIEGELKGTVSCSGTMFVAEGATVAATIDAENLTVAGDVSGEIRCRGRLQILPSGRVHAQATTGSLVIQEGAIYEGQLEMAGIDRAAPRPLRVRTAAPSIASESGSAERSPGNGTTYIRRLGSPEAPWEAPADAGEDEGSATDDPAAGERSAE